MIENSAKFVNKVAIFDSGIGGLHYLKACKEKYPNIQYYYYSDTMNLPYGDKSKEELLYLVQPFFEDMVKKQCKVILIACNTVTAQCIEDLRKMYDVPIIGVQPAVKSIREVRGKKLILCTPATAQSNSFRTLLNKYGDKDIVIHSDPLLAKLIEEHVFVLEQVKWSDLLPVGEFNAVVLGCTHYTYIRKYIEQKYKCGIYDGITGTVDHFLKIVGTTDHLKNSVDIMFIGSKSGRMRQIYMEIL